jgi:hypothetical protein
VQEFHRHVSPTRKLASAFLTFAPLDRRRALANP